MITINKKHLSEGLKIASAFTGNGKSLPILSFVKIDPGQESITITGTNLAHGIKVRIPAKNSQNVKPTLVNPKQLLATIAHTPGRNVTMKPDGASTSVESLASLPGGDIEDFPSGIQLSQENSKNVAFPSEGMAAIKFVLPAISKKADLYVLTGISFEPGYIIATDGNRLHLYKTNPAPAGTTPMDCVVPADLFKKNRLTRITRVSARIDEENIEIRGLHEELEIEVTARLIQGQFPDWKHVMPKTVETTAIIPRRAIAEALTTATKMLKAAKSGTRMVRLNHKNGILAVIYNIEGSMAEFKCPVKRMIGKFQPIHVDAVLLLDAVQSFPGDDLALYFNGQLDAIAIQEIAPVKSRMALVMPIRTHDPIPYQTTEDAQTEEKESVEI